MKKIYNKNAREKQLLEEAYGAIYERRNPDAVEGDFGNRNFKYLLKDVSELSSDPGMEDASSDDWRQRLDDIVRDYSEWRTVGEDEEAGDDEIGLTVKDPSKAYEDLEGGEGKYL